MTRFEEEHWDTNKEKLEDEMYQFKKRAILMQGIIDRTDCFHPLPVERINIFKLHECEEYVRFIYDDEASLPSGRKDFNEWWKEINSKIDSGSRVLLTGNYSDRYGRYVSRKDFSDRFYIGQNGSRGDGLQKVPDLPKQGVYEVSEFTSTYSNDYKESEYLRKIKELTNDNVKFKDEGIVKGKVWTKPDETTGSKKIHRIRIYKKESDLTIMYMPNEEATSGWNTWDTHDRKVRTRFRIEKDDDFIINYDQVSLEDIEFYLQSRVDRKNYLYMMPVLLKMKEHRLKELENEMSFADLVFRTVFNELQSLPEIQIKEAIMESINWWKFKNQWKRPIDKDDTLALRMITKRITSTNYKSCEKYHTL